MKSLISFIVLFLVVLSSIYNFLYGFLLNRSEIYEINSCDINSVYCKFSPYKRIVLLLVDSLKYEFIDPHLPKSNNYHGHVDSIRFLTKRKPKNVFVSHFISDPPTTTLQRIKALTTGSLPTFIDISTNFGSSELFEDNIINQWRKSGFDLKFVGDDTWADLFPNKFNTSIALPSFNIKDLDSTDKKVEEFFMKHLSEKTKGNNERPELILGHMLGIDHCGHQFGKRHSQMKRKLTELNDFIKKIAEFIDSDTLFVMFGDHGMTASGDHGGDSEEEVDAGLFVLSGKPLNSRDATRSTGSSSISQIDLVPTLAAMTGVAIPFSNLGLVQSDLLTSVGRARFYVDLNLQQVTRYISSYENKFGNLGLSDYINAFLRNQSGTKNMEDSINVLKEIKLHFQSKWAQFNAPLIYGGIMGLLLGLLCLLNYVIELSVASDNSTVTTKKFLLRSLYLSVVVLEMFFRDSYLFVFFFTVLIFGELFGLYKNRSLLFSLIVDKLLVIVYIIGLLNTLLSFSNSFIVSEDRIMQHFLQTILLIKTVQCILPLIKEISLLKLKKVDRNSSQSKTAVKNDYKTWFFILGSFVFGSLCLSFGLKYKICREEQRSWCSFDSNPTDSVLQLSLFLIPTMVILHRLWLRHCGNLASTDCNTILVKFLLPFSVVFLSFFHAMQFADESSSFSEITAMVLLVFPRIAFVSSMLVLVFLAISPLLMLHRKPFDSNETIDVPSLFRYLRNAESTDISITVHGLATVYSSFILTGLVSSCIFVSVFLKLQFVIGIVSTIGVLFAYSSLANLSLNLKIDNIFNSLSIPETIIFMVILTQYGFFATGHQTTIANIPWYSVFVGWKNDHFTRIIPAIMLNINLFSAQIVITLFGLLLPLFFLLITLGPANPFGNRSVNKNTDDNAISTINCGDFYLFKTDSEASRFRHWVRIYYLSYGLYHSIVTFCVILSTWYGRRHLMAWKVFVPKMIYSVINLLIAYLMTVVSYFLIMRIHRLALRWKSKNI